MGHNIKFNDERYMRETFAGSLDKAINGLTPVNWEKKTEMEKKNLTNRTNSKMKKENAQSEALMILERNASVWNTLLNKRKDYYFKLSRAASLLTLYNEGLNMTPSFVPQKFRQDESYITSQHVLDVMHNMNVQRLQSEITNIELKLNEYRKEINKIDEDILDKISLLSSEQTIIDAITDSIKEKIAEHAYKINNECAIRAQERMEVFREDIRRYREKQKRWRCEFITKRTTGQDNVDTHRSHMNIKEMERGRGSSNAEQDNLRYHETTRPKSCTEFTVKGDGFLQETFDYPESKESREFKTDHLYSSEEDETNSSFKYLNSPEKKNEEDLMESISSISKRIDVLEQGCKNQFKLNETNEDLCHKTMKSPYKNKEVHDFQLIDTMNDVKGRSGTIVGDDSEYEGPKHESRYKYYTPPVIKEEQESNNWDISDKPCCEYYDTRRHLSGDDSKREEMNKTQDSSYTYSTCAEKNIGEYIGHRDKKENSSFRLNERKRFNNDDANEYMHGVKDHDIVSKNKVLPIKDITTTIDKIIEDLNKSKRRSYNEEEPYETYKSLGKNAYEKLEKSHNNSLNELPRRDQEKRLFFSERDGKYLNFTSVGKDTDKSSGKWDTIGFEKKVKSTTKSDNYNEKATFSRNKSYQFSDLDRKNRLSYHDTKLDDEMKKLSESTNHNPEDELIQNLRHKILSSPLTNLRKSKKGTIENIKKKYLFQEKERDQHTPEDSFKYKGIKGNHHVRYNSSILENKDKEDSTKNDHTINKLRKNENGELRIHLENESDYGESNEKRFLHSQAKDRLQNFDRKSVELNESGASKNFLGRQSKRYIDEFEDSDAGLGYTYKISTGKDIKKHYLEDTEKDINERVISLTNRKPKKKNENDFVERIRSLSCSDVTLPINTEYGYRTSILSRRNEKNDTKTVYDQKDFLERSRFLRYTGDISPKSDESGIKRETMICLPSMNQESTSTSSTKKDSFKWSTGKCPTTKEAKRTLSSQIWNSFSFLQK